MILVRSLVYHISILRTLIDIVKWEMLDGSLALQMGNHTQGL
jgi:hypothetical protein